MDSQERGARNEARALHAFTQLHDRYPDFVCAVRRASPALDARGIDLLITIVPFSTGSTPMTVPVEVKSSRRGVSRWRIVHSDLHEAGVLIFFLPDDTTPRKLRRLMYRALIKIAHNSSNGTLYHGMWQSLFRRGSRKMYENIARIKAARKREK